MNSKVYLLGGDDAGWALDMDLRLTKEALSGVVRSVTTPEEADIIHTVCIEQLVIDPRSQGKLLPGKTVVGHFTSNPPILFELVPELFEKAKQWICVAQTEEAEIGLKALGLPRVVRVPYVGDLESFFPIDPMDPELSAIQNFLKIPKDKYVIGSFQRDSLGNDLAAIKLQKGPDILLGILKGVADRIGKDRIHVLLAGPRRHWLRDQLEQAGITYSFDGTITQEDDYNSNIVSLARLNQLTNLIDLYIIPSRWEGAPQAVFETITARRKIISTAMALPKEALSEAALFQNIGEAIDIVVKDIEKQSLNSTIDRNLEYIEQHSVSSVREFWTDIYAEIAQNPVSYTPPKGLLRQMGIRESRGLAKIKSTLKRATKPLQSRRKIGLWGHSEDPTLNRLGEALGAQKFTIELAPTGVADAHIVFSSLESVKHLEKSLDQKSGHVVHRVSLDGDTASLVDQIKGLEKINKKFATATLFSSNWCWKEAVKVAQNWKQPSIARDLADLDPNSQLKDKPQPGNPLRILSVYPRGESAHAQEYYDHLAKHLNQDKFTLTLIYENRAEFLERLKESDIFLSTSTDDGERAFTQNALGANVPSLFLSNSADEEYLRFCGHNYSSSAELLTGLESIAANYGAYQVAQHGTSNQEVLNQYVRVLGLD